MTRKQVTFRFVFEYDADEFPDYDNSDFESMAWDTLCQNFTDYRPQGVVETIDE